MSFLAKLAKRTKEAAEAAANKAAEAYENARVDDVIREERYDICKACPHFVNLTTTCTQCGCFMAAKTYLAHASCPIGKWQPIKIVSKSN